MKYTYLSAMLAFTSFIHAGIRPADGLWSTTDDPAIGSGLMLATQNGITVISVFTYDQGGNNAWYLASGQVNDEGVLEAELRQTQNGANILNENPAAAEFIEQTRTLRLEFTGAQIGTISIGGSEPKSMQTMHFGFYSQPTEQLLLADGTKYRFPSIDGKWVLGDPESGESYVLNLTNYGTGASPPSPNFSLAFLSNHPTTDNWQIFCPQRTTNSVQPYCRVFRRSNDQSFSEMRVDLQDLGNQRMTVYQNDVEPFESYQAFRLNKDRRLLPNDGYWRAYDDPAIGSGLVMRTQGIYTVALLYSYDEQGVPTWQIASGVFDENGYMEADLNLPIGGSAIENVLPMTASFADDVQTLEIQMQGLELATFSIDGSTPKAIQNYNFGVELFSTQQVTVMDEPYLFPNQEGRWVLVSNDLNIHDVLMLDFYSPNCCVSPRVPWYNGARGYDSYGSIATDGDVSINFICTISTTGFNGLSYLEPFCNSLFGVVSDFGRLAKLYFEDIGFNEFRYYIGAENDNDINNINRSSEYLMFFRLDVD